MPYALKEFKNAIFNALRLSLILGIILVLFMRQINHPASEMVILLGIPLAVGYLSVRISNYYSARHVPSPEEMKEINIFINKHPIPFGIATIGFIFMFFAGVLLLSSIVYLAFSMIWAILTTITLAAFLGTTGYYLATLAKLMLRRKNLNMQTSKVIRYSERELNSFFHDNKAPACA